MTSDKTRKRQWLLDRLLVPAGILPPAVSYEDLQHNEEMRQRIGNVGFEYFYLIKQDANKVKLSSVGKKIFAMHAPWPTFGHNSLENPILNKLANLVIFQNERLRLPIEFETMATNSFEFAKQIGARIIVFHIYFLNHHKIKENLAYLASLEQKYNITATIEPEGPAFYSYVLPQGDFYEYEGNHDWMSVPEKLIKVLDQFSPKHKFNLCLDTASLLGRELPILPTVKSVINRISHVHLSSSPVGRDVAGEIDRPEIAEVANLLYNNKYQGYITAEVNGAIGHEEEMLARMHGAMSLVRLNLLKKKTVMNAQRHIENSCRYLINYFS